MVCYTIEAAKKSGLFDNIIVSTDDEKISKISRKSGAKVIMRPRSISKDVTPTEPVILHVLKWLWVREKYRPGVIVLLQPTSPLRDEEDIRIAYKKFVKEKLDSLLSVTRNTDFIWRRQNKKFRPINYNYLKRPRRQEMEAQFRENGAIYIAKYSIFRKFKNRLSGKIGYCEMDEEKSIDIDDLSDLTAANRILAARKKKAYRG